MNKELLREIEISGVSVLHEDKAKNTMNILASWGQGGVENKNKREYSLPLVQREVSRVQKQVESGGMIGTGDHPSSGISDIATASHIVKKLWVDGAGKFWANLKILPTPRGKSIQEIVRAGGQLGLSSRGFGTVKNGIVQDDYSLQGIDIVMNPSAPGATFSKENIFESVDFTPVENEEQKKKRLIDESHEEAMRKHDEVGLKSKNNIMFLMYNTHVNANEFRGSFEEWRKVHEQFVDIALCEVNEDLTYHEAVKKVLGETEAEKVLKKEANFQEHVEIKDIYAEALAAGMDPKEYAKKINAEIDRQNESVCEDETKALLREAAAAGMNISDPEIREKYLNSVLQNKIDTTELSETEKARKKIVEAEKDERSKNNFLVGEKIAAGYKK